MKVFVQGTGVEVNLTQKDFVAQGGQASIYTKGGMAYKIYTDPKQALPIGKIKALSVLTEPNIVKPQNILVDNAGTVIGYTTTFVKDAYPMSQLFPKAFREREGLTHKHVQELVKKFRDGISHIHSKSILVVDMNESNLLVGKSFRDLFFIDTDSYQTAGYLCPVLMESVRDWTIKNHQWTELSDWFSFAVVSFQMFVGVHPFRGVYKGPKTEMRTKLPTDDPNDSFAITRRRMQGNVSVFDSNVNVSAAVYPWDVIPSEYLAWYKKVFAEGLRTPPPGFQGTVVAVLAPRPTAGAMGALDIMELASYGTENIIGMFSNGQKMIVVTDKGVWSDTMKVLYAPEIIHGCAFTPKGGKAILSRANQPLTEVSTQKTIPLGLMSEKTTSHDGRLYMKCGEQVHEVSFIEASGNMVASTQPVVNVLPNATSLYNGVVVQNLLGSVYVSLLSAPGISRQVRVKELDSYKIQDARLEGGVLMVVGRKGSRYDRLILRFDDSDQYDVRVVSDITPTGLNYVVLDSGVVVSMTEEDKLEIFSSRRGSTGVKIIEDKNLSGDCTLYKHGGSVVFTRGSKIFQMKMK